MVQARELPWRSRMARRVKNLPLGGPFVRAVRSFWGVGDTRNQWQRIVLNQETRKLVDGLGPKQLSALEVSGDSWKEAGYFREYRSANYPEFDICEKPLDEKFDLIIAEQVFEHLLWPYRAGRNVHAMLNPGGHFLIATPFMIKIHPCPHDCSRWTETGLKHLLAECGFPMEKIVTGSWGSKKCVKANLGWWQIYQPWRHSLRNDWEFPVQVWALAQK